MARRAACASRWSLALVVSVAAMGADGARAGGARRVTGSVRYATATEAFIDAGTDDGVATGMVLPLVRRGRTVGRCRVTEASPHHARCEGAGASRSDRVVAEAAFPPATPAAPSPSAAPAPSREDPLREAEVVERLRSRLLAAEIPKVVFPRARRREGQRSRPRVLVDVRHQGFFRTDGGDGFQRASLDAAVQAPLGFVPGLYASAAARVVGDVLAPPDRRFRPDEPLTLYVWEAAVGLGDRSPLVGAVGRFTPRKAPGLVRLDGAQAGLQLLGGGAELGAYAGAVPEIVTLAPVADRVAAGLYGGVEVPLRSLGAIVAQARLGVQAVPDAGAGRGELEFDAQALWFEGGSVGLGGRLSAAVDGAVALDVGRVGVEVTPFDVLRVAADYVYSGPAAVDLDALRPSATTDGLLAHAAGHHASAQVDWRVLPFLSVAVLGGAASIEALAATSTRGYVGPQLTLLDAFGGGGAISFGYLEELGAFAGRSAWFSSAFAPLPFVRTAVRLGLSETAAGVGSEPARQADASLRLDAPLTSWLVLRAVLGAAQPLPSTSGVPRALDAILVTEVGARASF
jgi:hypothetical protein